MKIAPMTHLTVENGASLYENCKDRVEGANVPGECTTDADCARTGCSGEVCATAAEVESIMTTCEVRLCYHVLDACSCVEGGCGWSLHPDGTSVETWPFRGADRSAPGPASAETPSD